MLKAFAGKGLIAELRWQYLGVGWNLSSNIACIF
jgi:hypothetical protein